MDGTRFDGWLFNAPISDINDQYTVTTRFDSKPATTLTLREFSGSGNDVWISMRQLAARSTTERGPRVAPQDQQEKREQQ